MPSMEQRPFGSTGLRVSVLGFGAGHIGSPASNDVEAARVLDAALEAGMNLIDTARGYELSEERIGRLLSHRRDEFVLSTKVGYSVPGVPDWSAAAVTGGVDRALGELATDLIDVCFLHSCSLEVLEAGEAVDALRRAQAEGKVRVCGYSGEGPELEWAIASGAFGAIQTSVNLADQWTATTLLPRAVEAGLGVIAKRPLANAAWRFGDRPVGRYEEPLLGEAARDGHRTRRRRLDQNGASASVRSPPGSRPPSWVPRPRTTCGTSSMQWRRGRCPRSRSSGGQPRSRRARANGPRKSRSSHVRTPLRHGLSRYIVYKSKTVSER